MANIRVTPEELKQQGGDLVRCGEGIDEILSEIDAKINEIIDGWDGLAQDAYFDMYSSMKESLKNFPEVIKSLGDATEKAADAFAQVDEELSQSFNNAAN